MAGIWLLLLCGSQLGHLLSNRHDFGDMYLIDSDDTRVVLRSALFTQISVSGCLRLHCVVLSLLFSRRVDALCFLGSMVSGDLRHL